MVTTTKTEDKINIIQPATPKAAPAKPAAKAAPAKTAPAKPAVKTAPAKAKAAPAKPATKTTPAKVKSAPVKAAPAAKTAKPAAKPVAKTAKAEKPKKPKLVRDSFTIPKDEYDVIQLLKKRGEAAGHPIKKSELLRAGIKLLAAQIDAAFKAALQSVPTIKTGRPKKTK